MKGRHYFIIEWTLVLILMGLCVRIHQRDRADGMTQTVNAGQQKICYLTFDDGPSKNTGKVLDILEEYNAKATFFLIGNEVTEERKHDLERMKEQGHGIGLHSNVHTFERLYADPQTCLDDYLAEYEALKKGYDIDTKLFRFPGGSVCSYMNGQRDEFVKIMSDHGFRCFDWNVSGEDSVGTPTVWSIQNHVFQDVFKYNEPIILLHDSKITDTTVEALPGILERIREEGYVFHTLDEKEEYVFNWIR